MKKESATRVDDSQYDQPLATAGAGSRSPRGFCAGRRTWTVAEDAVIRRRYANEPTEAVARDLGRSVGSTYQRAYAMGLKKSADYLATPAACRLHFGDDNPGKSYRYPKGHVPANKGLRRPGWGPGRMKATQFKAGTRAKVNKIPGGCWEWTGAKRDGHAVLLAVRV